MTEKVSHNSGRERVYLLVSAITIAVVFLLILVGGVVRSSGAGMGCPDWPKCFDQWVPPTDVSELPANYQEIYAQRGYADTSFNAVKTWTEYLNRLLGVLTGLFIIANLVTAWRAYAGKNKKVVRLSVAALVAVIIQGGVGAFVVFTHLHQGIITIHLLIALLIVCLLIAARLYSKPVSFGESLAVLVKTRWQTLAVLGLLLAQIIMGTQVREMLDTVSASMGGDDKRAWLRALGTVYSIHKSFWMVVTVGVVYLTYVLQRDFESKSLKNYGIFALLLTGMQVFTGVALNQFGLPAVPQALHIVFSSMAFAVLFALLLQLGRGLRQANLTQV
ncbi:MAG: COX15/CtaA family protein [Sphingobacteriaceae bacterium]|nr:COX15/CtaA family protein [Sphingobacteriaceae bacterium]